MDIDQLDHRQTLAPSGGVTWRRTTRVEMDREHLPRKAAWLGALLSLLLLGASATHAAQPCKLAVLGDSLTAGYGVAATDAFPVRLEEALRERGLDCTVVNAGVSGDTSAGGAARIEWVLADQPTHLLVELGGNDALRGLPVDQMRANIEKIVATAKARGVKVILAGMLAPPNLGRTYGDAFKEVFTSIAEAQDVPLYPFFLDGVILQRELMQPDGIHPNARGVAVIVERMAPFIVEAIQEG